MKKKIISTIKRGCSYTSADLTETYSIICKFKKKSQ